MELAHIIYLATPAFPVAGATCAFIARNPSTNGFLGLAARIDSELGVVLSQTCDMQRGTNEGRPWIHVAPVIYLSDSDSRVAHVLKHKVVRLVHIPWAPLRKDFTAVVDLDQIAVVERGIAMTAQTYAIPNSQQLGNLTMAISRYWSRPAFEDDVIDLLVPLQSAARTARVGTAAEWVLREAIREIRLQEVPTDDTHVRVTIHLLPYPNYFNGESFATGAVSDTSFKAACTSLQTAIESSNDPRTVNTQWHMVARSLEKDMRVILNAVAASRISSIDVVLSELTYELEGSSQVVDFTYLSIPLERPADQ